MTVYYHLNAGVNVDLYIRDSRVVDIQSETDSREIRVRGGIFIFNVLIAFCPLNPTTKGPWKATVAEHSSTSIIHWSNEYSNHAFWMLLNLSQCKV